MRVQVLSPLYSWSPSEEGRLLPLALVIDDDKQIREVIALILADVGCQVVQAADGASGIARLEESSPDLVILDVHMPHLDGWETLTGIRHRSDVPVLMLTAEETEENKVRGLVGGADDYVTKPVAPAELMARVQALLRRAKLTTTPPSGHGVLSDTELEPGELLGSYVIADLIAHGGMSSVYRARHSALDRIVALKVLSRDLAQDRVTRERFTNEWRIAGALQHPNIVRVHDAGEAEGRLFLAMDLISSGDLGDSISDGALPPARGLKILAQAAAALDAAHAAGLVHRDIKPGNILLDGDHAYLTDFGLSKLLHSNQTKLTAPGRMVGTADYLAPEQIRGEPVDARADVYAFGAVMFETLTASQPFDAESDYVLMYAHLERPVPRASERRPGLPEGVDDVIRRCMAKRREDRYDSPGEAIAALKSALGYE